MVGACATVTRGTHTQFAVESEPPGAVAVTTTGFSCASTPCKMDLPRRGGFDLTVSKQGYQPQVVHVESKVKGGGAAGFLGNAIIGGAIGAGIDVASGAMNDLVPNHVIVKLEHEKFAEPPPLVAYAPPPPRYPPPSAGYAPPRHDASRVATSRPWETDDRATLAYAPPARTYGSPPAGSAEPPEAYDPGSGYPRSSPVYERPQARYVLPRRYGRSYRRYEPPAAQVCPQGEFYDPRYGPYRSGTVEYAPAPAPTQGDIIE